jgi:hypothetical protein
LERGAGVRANHANVEKSQLNIADRRAFPEHEFQVSTSPLNQFAWNIPLNEQRAIIPVQSSTPQQLIRTHNFPLDDQRTAASA